MRSCSGRDGALDAALPAKADKLDEGGGDKLEVEEVEPPAVELKDDKDDDDLGDKVLSLEVGEAGRLLGRDE
jgi:hypothetical protein